MNSNECIDIHNILSGKLEDMALLYLGGWVVKSVEIYDTLVETGHLFMCK